MNIIQQSLAMHLGHNDTPTLYLSVLWVAFQPCLMPIVLQVVLHEFHWVKLRFTFGIRILGFRGSCSRVALYKRCPVVAAPEGPLLKSSCQYRAVARVIRHAPADVYGPLL